VSSASLRSLTAEELDARVRELQGNLFNHRIKHRTGQLANTASLRALRRDLARALTVQRARAAKSASTGTSRAAAAE
jgi:large subunit ribosomal protein L29